MFINNFAMLYIEDSFSPRKDETMHNKIKNASLNDKSC